ncbi:DUF447 family protein [Natrialba magadii ATCC 43099]|uniref:DUF447 family protein n=1 Tax=Natrialba magadii (strain ATCC 43099 / DSM 3394 / CCM 3739 / CIP 104546 / IAM 13178 / JCM 8861 / NBRC 102185 / NCIMB 2190 / MS3) TaxID=547559 RepID=D3SVR5_NATMM|nr:DUF447 domain-containing protein [Natrialba magadii]ADD03634.1 DUF447 family protein [Natrialba magadii ATCC 43099]ELY34401.1 hypothetical protein C500_00662 [Natrialba magadii ATCC 43099]
MSGERDGRDGASESEREDEAAAGPETTAWPVSLTGVTESVVTTLGPNGLWNAAALGLFAGGDEEQPISETATITARTWGNTRTRRNFHRQGEGYVQFVDDPVAFTDAALTIDEHEEPVLDAAAAWVRVEVTQFDAGTENGTDWEAWTLEPVDAAVVRETVPTIDRGFGAVIEATVAASRLGVPGYDDAELRERLAFFADVVDRAGDSRDRTALELVRAYSEW